MSSPVTADVLSNLEMFNLENDLPDELISPSASWPLPDNIGNPKPPAQGPGPGPGLQNGIDGSGNDAGPTLRQQIQLSHMLQQQVLSREDFQILLSCT